MKATPPAPSRHGKACYGNGGGAEAPWECPATDDFTADDIVHSSLLAQASLESDRRYQDDVYSIVAALRDIEAMARWEFANSVSLEMTMDTRFRLGGEAFSSSPTALHVDCREDRAVDQEPPSTGQARPSRWPAPTSMTDASDAEIFSNGPDQRFPAD